MKRYTVIKGREMRHPDGRRASIAGAWPGTGFYMVDERGWRVHDAKLDRCTWRAPCATHEEAQALADELNARGPEAWEENFGAHD